MVIMNWDGVRVGVSLSVRCYDQKFLSSISILNFLHRKVCGKYRMVTKQSHFFFLSLLLWKSLIEDGCPGTLRRVVWLVFSDVSAVIATSINKATSFRISESSEELPTHRGFLSEISGSQGKEFKDDLSTWLFHQRVSLVMEVANTSETSVNSYQSTRCRSPPSCSPSWEF